MRFGWDGVHFCGGGGGHRPTQIRLAYCIEHGPSVFIHVPTTFQAVEMRQHYCTPNCGDETP